MHKFRTKHNKLEQKDPTSIINITYNLQSCYLFNNESIFLGFSILGFIWFLQIKSEIRTDLTKKLNLKTQIKSERERIQGDPD